MDLLIEDGVIQKIGPNLLCEGQIIDACGRYVLPGFVDVHIHGGGGADFMDGTAQAFETVAKTHLAKGTTTLVATAMTAAREELLAFTEGYHRFKAASPYASVIAGMHLEGPYLSGAGKGAQNEKRIRKVDLQEVAELLERGQGNILRWDAAPEIPESEAFAKIMKENGVLCGVAHTDATAEETQAGFAAGFSHVTHFYNAVTAYKKRGQVVTAGVVEAAYLNEDVTVELICDGHHIPKACLQLALKVKGPDRVLGITDATRLSGTDLKTGKLGSRETGMDVVADDGVAKLPDLSSFAGSICTMEQALQVLCKDYGVDVVTAAKLLSTNPARHIGLEAQIGAIAEGLAADLVIADGDYSVCSVIKAGALV